MDDNKTNGESEKSKKDEGLSLKDVSIDTLKSDLEKSNGDEDKGGWFDFLSRHKKGEEPSAQKEAKESTSDQEPSNVELSPEVDFPSVNPEGEPKNEPQEDNFMPGDNGGTSVLAPDEDSILGKDLIGEIKGNSLQEAILSGKEKQEENFVETENKEVPVSEVSHDEEEKVPEMPEGKDEKEIAEEESILDKELEEYKEEHGQEKVPPEKVQGETPENLPVIESPRPSLSSFLPKKEVQEEKVSESSSDSPLSEEKESSSEESDQNKTEETRKSLKDLLGGDEKLGEPVAKISSDFASKGSTVENKEAMGVGQGAEEPVEKKVTLADLGSEGVLEKDGEDGKNSDNPFTSRLDPRKMDGNSLLQKVESAINYSASPEFAKEREEGSELAEESQGGGNVVDLREKKESSAGGFPKKKLIIIGGGVGGGVILVIILILIFSGSGGQSNDNTNLNSNANLNQNVNKNPVVTPMNVNSEPPQIVLSPEEVIDNVQKIPVSAANSANEISSALAKIKDGSAVKKLTQFVFLKTTGASISFKEFMDAANININKAVLAKPEAKPLILLVDFYKEKNVFGMVIPTGLNDDEAISASMKTWEKTMVKDLADLYSSFVIDNPSGYFADSNLFKNARYALIDKKSGLTLDYSVENGNVFITCGKDSMRFLQKEFKGISAPVTPVNDPGTSSSSSSSSGSSSGSSGYVSSSSSSSGSSGMTSSSGSSSGMTSSSGSSSSSSSSSSGSSGYPVEPTDDSDNSNVNN